MSIRPLFFCLLFMAHCLLPAKLHAGAGRPPGMTVALPAPDGFVEISAADHPGYVASCGAEAAYMLNRLNKFFIKTEELPAFMADDLNEISASFSYGFFHPGPQAYASLFPIEADTSYRAHLEAADAFERFNPLVYAGQLQAIERDFAERGKAAMPVAALDPAVIARWLEQDASSPGNALPIGLLESREEYVVYGWLQSGPALATLGLISPAPVAVFFAVIDAQGTRAYAAYAQRIYAVADVGKGLQVLSNYLTAHASRPLWEKDRPLPPLENGYNVLSHAAMLWFKEQKYEVACDAYKLLLALGKKVFFLQKQQYTDAAMLATANLLAGRPADALFIGTSYLEEAKKSLAPSDLRVLYLAAATAQTYAAMGDLDKTITLYDEIMKKARQSPSFPVDDHLGMMCGYGALLGDNQRLAAGRALLDEAFALSTEHFLPAQTAKYALWLMRMNMQEGLKVPGYFYGRLVAGLVAYNNNAGDGAAVLDPDSVNATRQFMLAILNQMGIATNEEAFDRLWGSANMPEDSPWNKARDWMTEAEAPLYARYAEVAGALHRAGESGTDQEKTKARADFADWLRAVQKMSD